MQTLRLSIAPSGARLAALATVAALLLLAGCPSEREVPPEYRRSSGSSENSATESAVTPSPDSGAESDASEGQAKSTTKFRYDKRFPFDGSVRFKLRGVCRGCSAGALVAEASVEDDVILITGEVEDCEGDCTKRLPASGAVTVKGLPRKMYTVRSDLWVTDVSPLKLGPAKRAAWAIYLLEQDCRNGLENLTGDEQGTEALVQKASKCLWTVPPDVRFQTISSMLTWKNNAAFVPDLIRALEDTKSAYLAARILGRIEDPRAVEPLIKTLASEDESLRWDAARALSFITGEELGEDQARWSAWYAKQGSRPIKRRAKRRHR